MPASWVDRRQRLEADQYADFGLFPLKNAAQIPDVSWHHVPSLHAEHALARLARALVEVEAPVDPLVATALVARRHASARESERPRAAC